MKALAIWCLWPFLSLSGAAEENQWYVGVDRASLPLMSFRADKDFRLPVEHCRQKGPLCLSTAAAAALRYYGTEIEPARLRALGKWDRVTGKRRDFEDGSTFPQIEDALSQINYHWPVRVFAGDGDGFREGMLNIHEEIAHGHPVIVGAYFGGGEGHAVLVCGYDDLDQLVYVLDSALPAPGKRVMTCDEFEMVWNLKLIGYPGRTVMFTLPKGEFATASEEPVARPATRRPQPPSPTPLVGPEKNADNRTGGFRPPRSRIPSSDRISPGTGQVADGNRALLKPFLP